jgi:hypothetical protein
MRIKLLIIFREMLQNHLLEKPGRVRDVPLWRTNINRRLWNVIFGFERRANRFGAPAGQPNKSALNLRTLIFADVLRA